MGKPENPIKTECNRLRGEIGKLVGEVRKLKSLDQFPLESLDGLTPDSTGEMKANATLALRHLEDARMRLGKTIQALEGGVSKYDRTEA